MNIKYWTSDDDNFLCKINQYTSSKPDAVMHAIKETKINNKFCSFAVRGDKSFFNVWDSKEDWVNSFKENISYIKSKT